MSCALTSIVTEVCSNAATANILLPGDPALASLHPTLSAGRAGGHPGAEPPLPDAAGHHHLLLRLHAARQLPAQRHRVQGLRWPMVPLPWCPGMKSWQMVMAGAGLNLVALGVSRLSGVTLVLDMMWWARSPLVHAMDVGTPTSIRGSQYARDFFSLMAITL